MMEERELAALSRSYARAASPSPESRHQSAPRIREASRSRSPDRSGPPIRRGRRRGRGRGGYSGRQRSSSPRPHRGSDEEDASSSDSEVSRSRSRSRPRQRPVSRPAVRTSAVATASAVRGLGQAIFQRSSVQEEESQEEQPEELPDSVEEANPDESAADVQEQKEEAPVSNSSAAWFASQHIPALHHGRDREHPDLGGPGASAQDPEQQERVPASLLDDHDWGPVSDDDKWCFMREFGLPSEEKAENPFYKQIQEIASQYGQEDTYDLCKKIQVVYETKFRPFAPLLTHQPWTLRSICAWMEKNSSRKCFHNKLEQIYREKILLMAKSKLCCKNPHTGERFDMSDSDARFMRWVSGYKKLSC